MLALHPGVVEAVWRAVWPRLPKRAVQPHPLGCHRHRVPDRVCFHGILIRLVTGCSWDVAGRLAHTSESTLRRRRDEWLRAGVFSDLVEEALAGYDRIIGLELEDLGVDGSPVGWVVAPANRNDCKLLEPTLDSVAARGLLLEAGSIHLDRGYDYDFVRHACISRGPRPVIPHRRPDGQGRHKRLTPLGLRWPVERTNSWLTNFGQLRRNTDRYTHQRQAALELAITLIITIKLVKWAGRWQPRTAY